MSPSEKHPHIEKASDEQLLELLAEKKPEIRDIYLAVHRLIVGTLPDIAYSTDLMDAETGYGARQYGYDGWGMAAVIAYAGWVSLAFFRGTELDDPSGLLEGGGKQIRHVKLRTMREFEEHLDDLRAFIEKAATLNQE